MKLAYRFPMAYRWKALKCQTRPLLTHSSHSNSIQTLQHQARNTQEAHTTRATRILCFNTSHEYR